MCNLKLRPLMYSKPTCLPEGQLKNRPLNQIFQGVYIPIAVSIWYMYYILQKANCKRNGFYFVIPGKKYNDFVLFLFQICCVMQEVLKYFFYLLICFVNRLLCFQFLFNLFRKFIIYICSAIPLLCIQKLHLCVPILLKDIFFG